ncbi:MAG: prepilin-type N-terminal cleavage/methylation domain-containing protein [Armatimonadota bacterium]|nr:prepilin-type N-terminal cleavage/methylation domain-containing protein [Armatimonadota bacterium]
MKRRGFTLIELLVVIAIIAILAAILFPVFARARENARKAICLSNSKQMGSALMMYYQDYEEALPFRQFPLPAPFTYRGYTHTQLLWYMALEPYYKNTQVFTCPSSDFVWKGQYTGDTRYGINTILAISPTANAAPIKLAQIQYPAETIMIGESDWTHSTADYGWSNSYMLSIPFHPSRFIPQRHFEGANIIFVDGHAKWYKIPLDPAYTGSGSVKQTLPPVGVKWAADGSR